MSETKTRGALVKARRNDLGLSQSDLAELVGVSRGTIRNIEADLVEPNKTTWASLEQILGWGPGSGALIELSGKPLELLPASVLRLLLEKALRNSQGVWGLDEECLSVEEIKAIVAASDPQGRIGEKAFTDLTNMIMTLPGDEEEHERLCRLLNPLMAEEPSAGAPLSAPRKKKLRPDERPVATGDLVVHEEFGLGRVLTVEGAGDKTKVCVNFGRDVGEKHFLYKYAPMEKLETKKPMTEGTGPQQSSPPGREKTPLPGDVSEILETGPVIDYEVIQPRGGEGITVVAMLVKTTDSRLSKQDRRYIADVWGRLEDTLQAGEETSPPQHAKTQPRPRPAPPNIFNPDEPPF